MREETLSEEEDTTIFHPSEIELGQTVTRILRGGRARQAAARRARLALRDPPAVAEQSPLSPPDPGAQAVLHQPRLRPSLFLDDRTSEGNDLQLHSMPHGVIVLEQPRAVVRRAAAAAGDHQAARRRLPRRLSRLHHPHAAASSSIRGWSRREHRGDGGDGHLASGIAEIDALLGGGHRPRDRAR